MSIPRNIFVHHTGGTQDDPRADTSNHTFEDVNAWHRKDPNVWLGKLSSLGYAIGYTYFIDKTGKVTQGRSDIEQAAHTQSYNNNPWDLEDHSSIGICLAGNFDVTFPTEQQIASLTSLLQKKVKEYGISTERIFPHRHVAHKSCYGKNLSDTWAADLLKPVVNTTCALQEAIIIEQKKKIAWYEDLFKWFTEMFS